MKSKILSLLLVTAVFGSVLTGCAAEEESPYNYEPAYTYSTASSSSSSSTSSTRSSSSSSSSVIRTTTFGTDEAVNRSSSSSTERSTISSQYVAPSQSTSTSVSNPTVTAPSSSGTVTVTSEPEYIQGINNETVLKYDTYNNNIQPSPGKAIYLHNFSTSLSVGVDKDGVVIATEAEYGIKGVALENRRLAVSSYDHFGGYDVKEYRFQSLDAGRINNSILIPQDMTMFTAHTNALTNGLYRIIAVYANGNEISLYFYINGDELWFCNRVDMRNSDAEYYQTSRSKLMNVINSSGTTPQNSLSLVNVWYPTVPVEGYRCDTDRWVALSNTFVDDSWSDEHKLYVINEWVSNNIAYDWYAASYGNSRAIMNGMDFSGKYSVYELRAGVCYDYANIIGIMCRAHGIPAITIGSESMNHVWNAVYVNGRWIEVDITHSCQYQVRGENLTRTRTTDRLYGSAYGLSHWSLSRKFPEDATANLYWQYNSWVVR